MRKELIMMLSLSLPSDVYDDLGDCEDDRIAAIKTIVQDAVMASIAMFSTMKSQAAAPEHSQDIDSINH